LASAGLVFAFCACASAAEPSPPSYLIDVWDTEDGLANSTVTAVAQTPDGYLWIGTYDGLARFDGMRFVTFDPGNTPELRHARVQALYVDKSGTLWIDTYRGSMTSYRNGTFHAEDTGQNGFDLHTTLVSSSAQEEVFVGQFGNVLRRTHAGRNPAWTVKAPPEGSRPIFQCADKDGVLWFLTREDRIVRFLNNHFEDLPSSAGMSNRVSTLAADEQGRVWAGAQDEIALWNGNRFEDMTPTNGESVIDPSMVFPTRSGALWVLTGDRLRKQVGRRWVAEAVEWQGLLGRSAGHAMGAHEDRDGGVWFNHYGNGLFHITPDGRYQRFTAKNGLSGDRVEAWYQGREGGVWLGIDRGGLICLRDRRFQVIGLSDGLPARSALSVCQTSDGAVWIGTAGGGLCRWNDGKITRYPVATSVAADFIFSLCPRPDGGLWLSARDEDLFEFKDGIIRPPPWETHGVKSILTDREGRLWIGSKTGLAWWTPHARRTFGPADGMAPMAIRALAEAPDGAVWCGADDGTLYRCGPDHLQAFQAHDALAGQAIGSLLADENGVIWAGTFRGGLLRFANGTFTRFTAKQGLYADVIGQILQDDQKRLWLGTHRGITCVSKKALNDCADGKTKTVDCVTYGRLDGLPTLEFADGYQPACWRGSDGRLWFATVRGIVSVKPEAITARASPPPVVIEEVRVDGEPLALNAGKLVIPPGHKQFEFRFTALSFDAPDKTRFRYRIDGLDDDWVDADTRRTAHYGNLPPNHYRFRVIACAGDGGWNEAGAALAFTVEPHFYQTWWFMGLMSVGILSGGAGVARRAATLKYRRELSRLEQHYAIERDRARIAQDIHDDLGAGLTQITLLGELARREPSDAGAHLDRISSAARQLTRSMDEIVWAVDPQHDTLTGLMDYVSAFAEDFLRVAGIHCRMDLPAALPQRRVDAELRYHLFLAVKEALNNVVKHARATEVWLRLRVEEKGFTLIVEDNGCGCGSVKNGGGADAKAEVQDRLASGCGLSNLQKRLHAVGGRCTVHSGPAEGTRVEMVIHPANAASPIMAMAQNGKNQ
jgi:signal transduction histidine kinase/ligand-binding sensor domain-containing protein